MAPKSKAGQRLAKWIEGLDRLADSLGLRWFMDEHGTANISFYLQEISTGKVLHGPFENIGKVEEKLNSIHLDRAGRGGLP